MVEIRRLTPNELQDYLRFMDGPAFETNPDWSTCYCQFYLNTPAENEAATKEVSRQQACDRILAGKLNGYLAYEGEQVVGWVAANSANNFVALPPADEKTARVLCFVVDREHQNQGIATALLNFAIEDLASRGFTLLEAAPTKSETFSSSGYRGKLSTFLKAGFEVIAPIDEEHLLVHRNLSA